MTTQSEIRTLIEEVRIAIDKGVFKTDPVGMPGLIAYVCDESDGWRIVVGATPDRNYIDGAASTTIGSKHSPLVMRLTPELAKRAFERAEAQGAN